MQQGRLIYPHEGLSEVSDVIEMIKHATVFSEESFHYVFDHSDGFFTNRNECRRLLTESRIKYSSSIEDRHTTEGPISDQQAKATHDQLEIFRLLN